MKSLEIPYEILNRLDVLWTFFLLIMRFTGFFYTVPGLGGGAAGIYVRMPAVIVLAFASLNSATYAALPKNGIELVVAMAMELLFGVLIGILPLLIVSGAQTAAQLASISMGFGAGQLMDPTTGGSVSDLGRIVGDLTVIIFLLLGGDQVAIHAVSGFSGQLVTGSFSIDQMTTSLFIDRTGDLFRIAVLLSAPVIVALLLTQFVMGLVTKAVPTVNIFIVSFPLTIGIGLILTVLALPDMMHFVRQEFTGLDNAMLAITKSAVMK